MGFDLTKHVYRTRPDLVSYATQVLQALPACSIATSFSSRREQARQQHAPAW